MFTNVTYDTEISMFLIRSDLKAQIRNYLSIEKNINEQTLFPDLSAFAKEMGSAVCFRHGFSLRCRVRYRLMDERLRLGLRFEMHIQEAAFDPRKASASGAA